MSIVKKIFGWILIFFGLGMLTWVGYNLFIEMLPAAEGKSPIYPIVIGILFIYAGIKRVWVKNKLHTGEEK